MAVAKIAGCGLKRTTWFRLVSTWLSSYVPEKQVDLNEKFLHAVL